MSDKQRRMTRLDLTLAKRKRSTMKLKNIKLTKFRRFEALTLDEIPPVKMVIMAGPNGSGKSSLFDAFSVWLQANYVGLNWDPTYHSRDKTAHGWSNQVSLEFHSGTPCNKSIYLRSAYRNDPDFQISSLSKQTDPVTSARVRRMIDQDGAVSQNYQRLASDAFEDAFDRIDGNTTLQEFREGAIGEIRRAVQRLFPHLDLDTLGNPLTEGTFRFTKGMAEGFSYKNLSGGEKSAFDLLLDMIVKRRSFDDTVFAIDEPEAHMNTRLQGALLGELFDLIPDGSQLWVATHSIGMMRKARDLFEQHPEQVAFYDFEGHDYDQAVTLKPVLPDRNFWQRILSVALDDLADLIAPKEVVICEGNPKVAAPCKNEEHDAKCYNTIFAAEFPDTAFISGGNSHDVANDRLRFAAVLPNIIKGIVVSRLIDRDDHSPADAASFRSEGLRILTRRHIECYLYDDEIISLLYEREGRADEAAAFLARKASRMADATSSRGRPGDDVKASAAQLYQDLKKDLQLVACGNDELAFARNVLAPLVKPETTIYQELKRDIFGA